MEQLLAPISARSVWRRVGAAGMALCVLTALACGSSTPTAQPSTATGQHTTAPGRPSTAPTSPGQTSPAQTSPPGGGSAPGGPTAPTPVATPTPPQTDGFISTLMNGMTTDQKIGQLFMVSFYGDTANETNSSQVSANEQVLGVANIAEAISTYHLGGVIFFDWAGNMVSPRQVATLSNSIQSIAASQPDAVPMLISTDQEGGEIVRLPSPATQFPGNMALGATRSTTLARSTAAAIGAELRAEGLNQVLAPDSDVNVNPANPVIGVRSFGSDPALVSTLAQAMVAGFQTDAGLGATVKHFPGHGDTDIDSHTALPTINHTLAQWTSIDEPPFAAAVSSGVDVVMVGHLAFPALDSTGTPASLSGTIINNYLRGQLGFKGVVMTDALTMGALRNTYGDAGIAVKAVQAGEDILLMPQSLSVAYAAVQAAVANGTISMTQLNNAVRKDLQLKQSLGLFSAAPVNVTAAKSVLSSSSHKTLEAQDAHKSVTLLANDGGVLPLTNAAGDGPYLVVGTSSAWVYPFTTAVRAHGVTATTYVTGPSLTKSVINAVAASTASFGTVFVLTVNADTSVAQQNLVAAVAATGKRLITVSLDHPYDEAYYRAAVNLALYSSSAASLTAAVGAVFGDFAPSGELPVSIPDPRSPGTTLYPFGFGLTYH